MSALQHGHDEHFWPFIAMMEVRITRTNLQTSDLFGVWSSMLFESWRRLVCFQSCQFLWRDMEINDLLAERKGTFNVFWSVRWLSWGWTWWSWRSFPTRTIPWFYGMEWGLEEEAALALGLLTIGVKRECYTQKTEWSWCFHFLESLFICIRMSAGSQ